MYIYIYFVMAIDCPGPTGLLPKGRHFSLEASRAWREFQVRPHQLISR